MLVANVLCTVSTFTCIYINYMQYSYSTVQYNTVFRGTSTQRSLQTYGQVTNSQQGLIETGI